MGSVSNGSNGRGAKGYFAPGNRFGKGNPHAKRTHEIRTAFLEAATPEKYRQLTEKLFDQAMEGDTTAARLVFEYGMGKAAQSLEITGNDGEGGPLTIIQILAIVNEALAPFPDAKTHLAMKLKAIHAGDARQPGDGA